MLIIYGFQITTHLENTRSWLVCGGNSFGEISQLSNGMIITQWHRAPFRVTNQVQVLPPWGRGGFSVPAAHSQAVSIAGLGQIVIKRML